MNPSVLDTITGYIIKDSQGEAAKLKLPQRRLNMVDAAISSQCCILNSTERLELVRRSNEVAAIMGEIEIDRSRIKEAAKRKKEEKRLEKIKRQKLKHQKMKQKEKEAREICVKAMQELSEKGDGHITKLTVPVMKALIQYVFKKDAYKRTDIRKAGWVTLVQTMYEEYLKSNQPNAYSAEVNEVEAATEDFEIVLSDEESFGEDSV